MFRSDLTRVAIETTHAQCATAMFLDEKCWNSTLYLVIPASVTGGFQFSTTKSLPLDSNCRSRQDSGTENEHKQ